MKKYIENYTKQRIILSLLVIALCSIVINIHSSTTDEPQAAPEQSVESLPTTQGKTEDTEGITEKIHGYLEHRKLPEAVTYITDLDLNQNALIEVLSATITGNFMVDELFNRFYVLTFVANKQLHDNVAIEQLGMKRLITVIIRTLDGISRSDPSRTHLYDQIKELIQILAKAGGNFKNTDGASLLSWAIRVMRPYTIEFALFLLGTGYFDPNLHDRKGQNALETAVNAYNLPVVQYLLEHNLMRPDELNRVQIPDQQSGNPDPSRIYELIAAAQAQATSQSTGQASSTDQGNLRR